MINDLFSHAAARRFENDLCATPEHNFLVEALAGHMKPRSKEPIWQYADREIWLDEKMSADGGRYKSWKTPWAREIQDIFRDPACADVREVNIMKPSRSGITEGLFNVIRWMPDHKPGNVLYAINSREEARLVSKRRIIPGIEHSAKGQLTEDKNDKNLSMISLKNMDIVVSGSGSAGPFMQAWYRLIILDELENHIQTQDTTTEQRATSRQTDVDDGLIVKISKPERIGGIIHRGYVRGDQRKYLVPCPRCERVIELVREHVVIRDCKNSDGTWDLDRVVKEAYRVCPLCQKPFYEHEKRDMVNSDLAKWTPTPPGLRMKMDGKPVPAEPNVRSYHLSDWLSLHARASTGELMKMWLMANEITPTESSRKYFLSNHEGLPYGNAEFTIDDDSIDACKGGRIEQREIEAADGTKQTVTEVLGIKYYLAYEGGKFQHRLPFRPALITIFADKQQSLFKCTVWAWMANGERYLIDIIYAQDEDQLVALRERPYWIEKEHLADPDEDEPMFIVSGLVDARHRPMEVYRMCLNANREHGWQVWPVKGEGDSDEYANKKLFRLVKETCDGQIISVRWFWDRAIKDNFYLTRLQKRCTPRMWHPWELPQAYYTELTSEKFDDEEDAWIHPDGAPPNDFGDTAKYGEIFLLENAQELKTLPCSYPRIEAKD